MYVCMYVCMCNLDDFHTRCIASLIGLPQMGRGEATHMTACIPNFKYYYYYYYYYYWGLG